jgi:hypothetical protein
MNGRSPRTKRVHDDLNVTFQLDKSQVFKGNQSTRSIQNFEDMNVCTESELLRSKGTDDLSRHAGRDITDKIITSHSTDSMCNGVYVFLVPDKH